MDRSLPKELRPDYVSPAQQKRNEEMAEAEHKRNLIALRDQFAGHAMMALVSTNKISSITPTSRLPNVAIMAYAMADAMLIARQV